MARQVKVTKDLKAPSIKDKAKVVSEAPTGPEWEKVTVDGEEVYRKKTQSSTPKDGGEKPYPVKSKPSTAKKGTPTKPKPRKESFETKPKETSTEEYVRVVPPPKLKEPAPKETSLMGEVQTYGNRLPRQTANQTWDTYEFADPTGNTTNQALRANFEGKREVVFDAQGNKTYTGKTLDDYRNQSIQQIETPQMSGVNKTVPKYDAMTMPGVTYTKNAAGGMGVNKATLGTDLAGATDSYVPKKYDSQGKEIPTDSGLKPLGTTTTKKEVGKMTDVEQPVLIKGEFAKGGVVKKVRGYADGTTGSGVVGQNDPYAAARAEEEQKKKDAQNEQNRQNVGNAMGGYGKAYVATAPNTGSQDSATKTAMGAVSDMGAVGGVIGGVYGIIDKPAREEKNKAEKINVTYDANGNAVAKLDSSAKAKDTAIAGSFLSPSEAISTRMSYEGGMTDVSGKGYTDYLEKKAQEQLDVYNKANVTNKQNQAVAAREQGNLNPTITNQYNLRGASFNDAKQLEGVDQQYAKGGLVKKIKGMYSDGGEIKGKGGPKEDKIEAKVEEGSFVVPAENAEMAKGIRKLYLKAPIKKANLKQEEGEEVKLSNGEHLFTPEENEYLESIGINLEDLAPNAEDGEEEMKNGGLTARKAKMILHDKQVHGKPLTDQQRKFFGAIASGASMKMACGGHVKGYAEGGDVVDPAKELAKIEAERKNIDAIKAKRESDRTAAEKAALQRSIIEARNKDRQSQVKSWEKKYNDSKAKLDALNKTYEETVKGFESMGNATKKDRAIGVAGTKDAEYQRKTKEELLKKIQEADKEFKNAKQTYDYVKDDNNYTATGESKIAQAKRTGLKAPVVPKDVKKSDVVVAPKTTATVPQTTSTTTAKKQPTTVSKTEPFTVNANPDEEVIVPGGELSPNEKAIANADAEKATVQAAALNKSLPQSVTETGTPQNRRKGIMDVIGNVDPTAFVGVGQAVMGKNMLAGEKRPVDKAVLDPTYNASVEKALQQATYGLSPEEKLMAQQDIENAKRDAMKVGVNYAGGSGTQAFNLNRAAINDAWKAKLGLTVADQEARMVKQKYADAMAADRAGILAANRRQAFNDAMYTFQQKQQAGSELVGAGLQNIIGAYRFNREMKNQQNVNDASNPYKNV